MSAERVAALTLTLLVLLALALAVYVPDWQTWPNQLRHPTNPYARKEVAA
jgi:hypothetical protein